MIKKALFVALFIISVSIIGAWVFRDRIFQFAADYFLIDFLNSKGVTEVEREVYDFDFSMTKLSSLKGRIGALKFHAESIELSHPEPFQGKFEGINIQSLNLINSISFGESRLETSLSTTSPLRIKVGQNEQISIEKFSSRLEGALVMGDKKFALPETKIDKIVLEYGGGSDLKLSAKVKIKGIDLSKVLSLYDPSGSIKVSGLVDIEFPITQYNVFNPSIKDGTLLGNSGSILWPYTEGAGESGYGEFARKALEDLRYHEMNGGFSISAKGDLKLKLNLKGTSPKAEKNRPIHLNINLEENLPALAKSLRLINRFPRELAEKHGG